MKNYPKMGLFFSTLLCCFSLSCSNENAQNLTPGISDSFLFEQIKAPGYRFYLNDSSFFESFVGSGHSGPVRIRFNAKAQGSFDSTGRLPVSATFPDKSMVVKELYSNGMLQSYAFMYKSASDPNSAGGWLWGYMNLSGVVTIRANKGQGCIGCHSIEGNRDLVRVMGIR